VKYHTWLVEALVGCIIGSEVFPTFTAGASRV
jgi:hypothetical protein